MVCLIQYQSGRTGSSLRTPTLRSGGLKLSMIRYGKGGFPKAYYIKVSKLASLKLGGAFLLCDNRLWTTFIFRYPP